jgi:hypothetical protein
MITRVDAFLPDFRKTPDFVLAKEISPAYSMYTLRGEWGDVTNLRGYTGLAQLYCGAH